MTKTFSEIFVSFAIVGLFVFAMISFVSITQQKNSVNDTILNDQVINSTFIRLNSNLSSFQSQTEEQKEGFESEVPTAGFGSLLLFSIVSGGRIFTSMIMGVYNAIIVLPATVLQINEVVFSVITGLFVVLIILGLWRLYKLGG